MKRKRSHNLGPKEIDIIVGMLDGWADALSWNHLIDAIELRLPFRYTRQALSNHEQICEAFRLAKVRLLEGRTAGAARKPKTPEEPALSARLARRDVTRKSSAYVPRTSD